MDSKNGVGTPRRPSGSLRRSVGLLNLGRAGLDTVTDSIQEKASSLKRPHPVYGKVEETPVAPPHAAGPGTASNPSLPLGELNSNCRLLRAIHSEQPSRQECSSPTTLAPAAKHQRGANGRPSLGNLASTADAARSTPKNSFRSVKPLQTAFMSTGLLSKRNRMRDGATGSTSQQPPETPCKKPPAGSGFQDSANQSSTGRWLFHPPGALFASEQDRDHSSRNCHSDTSLMAAEGRMRRVSLTYDAPETPTKVEAISTSTPVAARPFPSDASTVTPGHASGIGTFTSPSPSLRAPMTRPNTSVYSTSVSGPSLYFDYDEEAEHSLTSSDLGSPRTPDVLNSNDTAAHLVGMLSMENSGTAMRHRRPRYQIGHDKKTLVDINTRREEAIRTPLTEVPCTPVESEAESGSISSASTRTTAGQLLWSSATHLTSRDSESRPARGTKSALFDASLASRFEHVSVLGSGEFSIIYTVVPRNSPGQVKFAVKRTKKGLTGIKSRMRRLEEVSILHKLTQSTSDDEGRDYVIHLHDSWEDNGHLYIMTEFCENGNLDQFLSEWGNSARLDEWRVWKILIEIAFGLRYIHSQNVLHLDLKPANIFITFEGTLKIGDFGMATKYPVPSGIEREGDREYIAPEVLGLQQYDKPADIFSFGMMIVETAANIVLPDNGEHWQRLRSGDLSEAGRLSSGDLANAEDQHLQRPPWAPSFMVDNSRALDKLVMQMLSPEPAVRPTAQQILELPEAQLVEMRRHSGAIVYEGDFGPPPEIDGPSWQS